MCRELGDGKVGECLGVEFKKGWSERERWLETLEFGVENRGAQGSQTLIRLRRNELIFIHRPRADVAEWVKPACLPLWSFPVITKARRRNFIFFFLILFYVFFFPSKEWKTSMFLRSRRRNGRAAWNEKIGSLWKSENSEATMPISGLKVDVN